MTHNAGTISIRDAEPADVPLLVGLIRELAEYERRLDEVTLQAPALAAALFGAGRLASATLAEVSGEPAGFALYWFTFGTFRARRNLYIEDLFVRPAFRALGVGRLLVQDLARRVAHGGGRLEWSVLAWNEPAIAFYRKLGGSPVTEWAVYELDGAAMSRLVE